MKKSILLFAMLGMVTFTFAQKKRTTTSANITFDATTPKDALPKAENKTVVASLDTKTGAVAFEAIVKGFTFGNPMMQDHFNGAQWMDSEKNPTATFKGKIASTTAVNFKKDGTYTSTVAGDLTMHGITKPVTATVTVTVKGKAIATSSSFSVKLADFGITGPAIGAGKVAEEPRIIVAANFK
jgi:polyisoprenoid-binding protein YceI